MSKKINRSLIQDILAKGEGVKTVSGEAVDWCIAVAEVVAKNLAESGRRTPGGRLMAPKMDAGLMARHAPENLEIEKDLEDLATKSVSRPVPERLCSRAKDTLAANGGKRPGFPTDPEATTDWKYEVGNGDTLLGYYEWLDNKKEFERAEMRAEEEHEKE